MNFVFANACIIEIITVNKLLADSMPIAIQNTGLADKGLFDVSLS